MAPDCAFVVRRFRAGDSLESLQALVHAAFAALDIDPPSSALREAPADFAARLRTQTVFVAVAQEEIVGCVFCEPQGDALYAGRLAVASAFRRRGIAEALMRAAAEEARARGLRQVTLRARIALSGNVALFSKLGFAVVREGCHPGYAEPTFYDMALPV